MSKPLPMRLCIHGHFYQPPRENPWTGEFEAQESALPHHDWNERIARECYAPNGASRLLDPKGRIRGLVNNYRWMSFNFGPTLLEWLDRHDPETLERIREADRLSAQEQDGHGNALAQVYNHAIMPLGTDRDRRTQIEWGIRDFQDRFGRLPEGMWLAETAIDMDTVVALIRGGIRFTVLAPTQAHRVRVFGADDWKDVSDNTIDPGRAYRIYPLDPNGEPLCAGHLDVFFYDGPISSAVGFEHLLRDASAYLARLKSAWVPEADLPRLVSVGTDGESYGHHEPFGDMALAYLFETLVPAEGIVPTNFGHFLSLRPPVEEVRLKNAHGEGTAWSCAHGTGRWHRDCGCSTGGGQGWNQAWRTPLRQAMDRARHAAEAAWDALSPTLFRDPWNARIDWISTRTGRTTRQHWLETHLMPGASLLDAHRLMELVRMGQFALTSCAWFFDDLGGLEPVQNMRYALRVCELLVELGRPSPEPEIRAILSQARSNVENRSGEWIWDSWVRPHIPDARRQAAQVAVRTLAGLPIPAENTSSHLAGEPAAGFALLRTEVTDPVSGLRKPFRCLAHSAPGESARAWLLEGEGPFPDIDWTLEGDQLKASLDVSWLGRPVEASEFDLDTRRDLAEARILSSMEEVHGDLETLDQHACLSRADLLALHVPLPPHLSFARRLLLEEDLASTVLELLRDPAVPVVERIRAILASARSESVELRLSLPGRIFDRRLQELMTSIWPVPEASEVATLLLLLDLAEEAKLPVSKAPLENLAFRLRAEHLHPLLRAPTPAPADRSRARAWIDVLERLNFDMDLERELVGPTTTPSTEVAA